MTAADGARPVSCLRLLQLARHVTPGRLQLQITNAARSAPSLRYGARPLANSRQTAHPFAFLPRADARKFGILEVRAPRRCSGTLTGTPGQTRKLYCTTYIFLFKRGQRDSSLRSNFFEILNSVGKVGFLEVCSLVRLSLRSAGQRRAAKTLYAIFPPGFSFCWVRVSRRWPPL